MTKAYKDPTADRALSNLAEQAQREYEERHRKKSPTVEHYSDKKQSFIDFMNGNSICPKCGSANLGMDLPDWCDYCNYAYLVGCDERKQIKGEYCGIPRPSNCPLEKVVLCRDCGEVIESE